MSDTDENWVLVFAKSPRPGRVKTRLAGLLGPEGASRLYEALLTDTVLAVASVPGVRRVIACDPPEDLDWFVSRFGDGFQLTSQGPGDFGQRLHGCFEEAFAQGARRAVVVGSDLPTLNGSCIAGAFRLLHSHDLVLGPADDGGYYLMGLARMVPELFQDVDWSTDRVLDQTLDRARRARLTFTRLDAECDVDDGLSLRKLVRNLTRRPESTAANTRRVLRELDVTLILQET